MKQAYIETLSDIHHSRDYFFHDLLQHAYGASEGCRTFLYRKFEFLESAGLWRGKRVSPPTDRELWEARTLALGHSDSAPNWKQIARLKVKNPRLQIWASNSFANRLTETFGFFQMPLGLSNPTNESAAHKVAGNSELLVSQWRTRQEPEWSLYANFRPGTNPKARRQLLIDCERADIITVGKYEISVKGRQSDLKNIAKHGLVICPEGNGPDTHRLWEVLYLGGIPVVLKNSYQHKLLRRLGLPVIGVQRWALLNSLNFEPLVEREWQRLKASSANSLRGSFWVKKLCPQ